MIESCCKTILENKRKQINRKISINQLVDETIKILVMSKVSICTDKEKEKILEQILGNLKGLAGGIFRLRDHYGSGHGKNIEFEKLAKRHADLSVGSSIIIVRYLWDIYLLETKEL